MRCKLRSLYRCPYFRPSARHAATPRHRSEISPPTQPDRIAFRLSVATGVAALLLTMLTNHRLGVIRVLPYWSHLAMDRLVGLTFAVAPFALGFSGIDAVY